MIKPEGEGGGGGWRFEGIKSKREGTAEEILNLG